MSIKDTSLLTKLIIANQTVKTLLSGIEAIENNTEDSVNERLSQIKKIKEEITKVGHEIDNIKQEIKLLRTYHIN